jgi:arsenate reductase
MSPRLQPTADEKGKPIILVLCTGNSCRSQMAEGFLRKYHGNRFAVRSGGTQPAEAVHPRAIEVMKEVGIDLSNAVPQQSGDFLGHVPVRHLVIVCDRAKGTCPRVWPGAATRHYLPFDDPADATGTDDEILAVFRRVRDEIDAAMKSFDPGQSEGDLNAARAAEFASS